MKRLWIIAAAILTLQIALADSPSPSAIKIKSGVAPGEATVTSGRLDVNAVIPTPVPVTMSSPVPLTVTSPLPIVAASPLPITGTVNVGNFPNPQPISVSSPLPVAIPSPISVTVLNQPSPTPTVTVTGSVSVGNFPAPIATQPVSGTVNVGNLPVTQPVSGTVAVSDFPSTQNVAVTSSVIPTGAATSANQVTANTSLNSIDGKAFLPTTVSGTGIALSSSTGAIIDALGYSVAYLEIVGSDPGNDSANATVVIETSGSGSTASYDAGGFIPQTIGGGTPLSTQTFPVLSGHTPNLAAGQVRIPGRFLKIKGNGVTGTATFSYTAYLKTTDNFDDFGRVNAASLVDSNGNTILDGFGHVPVTASDSSGNPVANASNQATANASLSTLVTNTTGVATAANQVSQNTNLSSLVTNTGHIPASPSQEHTTAASPASVRLTDGTSFYKGTTPADTQPVSIATLPALASGTNVIGKVTIDTTTPGTTNAVSIGSSGSVALLTGSALVGKVGIDQTTNGTTNRVNIGTDGAVSGVGNFTAIQPTAASFNGTMVTTAGATIARDSTLGSPFQAGGSIGNTSFISTQATAANLNGTMVTTGGATIAKDSSITALTAALGTPMQQTGGSVAGTKSNNNAAPGATNIGTLPALANAAPPTFTEGDQVTESLDLGGNLRAYSHPVNALGYYAWNGTTGQYAALAANTPLFSFRWGSATGLAVILKVEIMVMTTTTASTAGITERQLIVARSFTASDSGGTAATLTGNNQKRRTSQATSLVTDLRIGPGLTAGTRTLDSSPVSSVIGWSGLLSTGVVIGASGSSPVGAARSTEGGGIMAKLLDATNGQDYPIVLAQNEGIVVRIGAAEPTGATQQTFVNIIWAEVTGY